MRPSGLFIMSELDQAGGVPVILRELLSAGLVDGDALTVNGRTLAQNVSDAPVPDGRVVRPATEPFQPDGGLAVLRGSLVPERRGGQDARHRVAAVRGPGPGVRARGRLLRRGHRGPGQPRATC